MCLSTCWICISAYQNNNNTCGIEPVPKKANLSFSVKDLLKICCLHRFLLPQISRLWQKQKQKLTSIQNTISAIARLIRSLITVSLRLYSIWTSIDLSGRGLAVIKCWSNITVPWKFLMFHTPVLFNVSFCPYLHTINFYTRQCLWCESCRF